MKRLLVSFTSAALLIGCTSMQATLLLYDPFDYTAGERLGGSGTSPLGQIAPNGQQWITRSPASGGTYNPLNDTLITPASLSYGGLKASIGNSVRYGSSGASAAGLYTDAIALPSAVSSGSLYYSAIVRFQGPIPAGGARTSYAAFSTDTANPLTDAGLSVGTASGTGNIPLPASAWIRNGGVGFQLGGGKQNSDGLGPGATPPSPSWQSTVAGHPYPNQQGNFGGTGQDYATIADDIFFLVMKYTFNNPSVNNDDTVSMWINPIASTLGDNGGEAIAGAAGGSYYSAINAYTTPAANLDASQIQSFMLIGLAQSAVSTTKSIDITLDELRIGTTWADVTPIPEPGMLALLGLGITGLLCLRRRN